MSSLSHLISNNRTWSEGIRRRDPEFFSRLSRQQRPRYLWIGCADSRVPANDIVGLLPGELFVHRNIANVVVHTDLNCLSVMQFAVDVLNIEHIIVCGHYGCGGVKAAMENEQFGLVDNWLRFIKDVYRTHSTELDGIADREERFDRFVELNVIEQVLDLSKTTIIQNAWNKRNSPKIHGWVYSLKSGLIKDLEVSLDSELQIPHIYRVHNGVDKRKTVATEEG